MKQLLFKNKVFIIGLLMSIGTAAYEVFDKGQAFSWWVMGWSVFIAALSYAGKNLRGQAASIAGIILSTAAAFYTLHETGDGVTVKIIVKDLLWPLLTALVSVLWTSPSASVRSNSPSGVYEAF